MFADHIKNVVVEFVETGTVDVNAQQALTAVQPLCLKCMLAKAKYLSEFASAIVNQNDE